MLKQEKVILQRANKKATNKSKPDLSRIYKRREKKKSIFFLGHFLFKKISQHFDFSSDRQVNKT